jgi:hypothetical protein
MITAENQDSISPPWWTLAQMLVWIRQQVRVPPQDAAQYCDELTPKIIEEALDALTRALFDVICGAVEGMPIVAARIRCGSRYEDLATFFQPLPSQPNALDALRYDLRQCIRQPDVEFNPVWGERSWPARVSAAPTRPTESEEPIPAAKPGPEESQPPNKSDLVDAPTPAGPAGIINIGHDPAIRRAIAHALEQAKPATIEPAPRVEPAPPSEPSSAADVGDRARGPQQPPETRELASVDVQSQPQPPVPKLPGKQWVPVAYARRPDELHAMGITGASAALAKESESAADCARPLTARYIENLLRDLKTFPKAHRGSKQSPK